MTDSDANEPTAPNSKALDFDTLVAAITDEHRHPETDWGSAVGVELDMSLHDDPPQR